MKLNTTLVLTAVCVLACSNLAYPQQRMGLLSGGSARIPAGSSGSLPTVCLDEHGDAPTTATRYSRVLNTSSPDAVTVEIEGRSIPLQKAIDDGLVRVSGVSSPEAIEAYIDEVRIENLSGKAISVTVSQPAVLGTTGHSSFDYDVSRILGRNADQDEVWRQQPQLALQWQTADRAARQTVRQSSTNEVRLFHFSTTGRQPELVFADGTAVPLSESELDTLRAGKPLSATHPLSKRFSENVSQSHVVLSDPTLDRNDGYVKDRNELSFGLQAAYPRASIYRDPLTDETYARAKKLNEFQVAGAEDLVVVIPDSAEPKLQVRTITNICEDLAKANVEIKRFRVGVVYDGKSGRAVFVITGHSSQELATFVGQLGQAGFFRDNYVILNSCGVGPSPALVYEINSKYGALGTFSFHGEIRAAAVQNYMLDLVDKLREGGPKRFVPLLIDSVRDKALFGIFTISKLLGTDKPDPTHAHPDSPSILPTQSGQTARHSGCNSAMRSRTDTQEG